ncbi:MAG: hypothetical protein RIB80_04570 [Rhodospirillales bacterium]
MRHFRPLWLVVAYFGAVGAYGLWPVELTFYQWAAISHWHELLLGVAGLSFAFRNEPADKAAMVVVVAYLLGLAIVDPLLDSVYGPWLAFVAAAAVGWVFWIRRTAARRPGEKSSG